MPTAPTLIFETLYGSHAYGLAGPTSDLDLRGVVVGPAAWYHGFVGGPEQIEHTADHVWVEVRKAFRLTAAGNPTMLETLWTHDDDHRLVTAAGRRLLDARGAFLSQRVAKTFSGYALAQMRRIRTHRAWLLSPPEREPRRADFGLPERATIPKDELGAAEALIAAGRLDELPTTPGFLALLDRERHYRAARRHFEQYLSWKRERNPARAELEARYGYDTKHAMHLIRLLRMGAELVATGVLVVRRPDRDELLAIRAGAHSFEALEAMCARHEAELASALATTPLPPEPDEAALDALCQSIVAEVLAC